MDHSTRDVVDGSLICVEADVHTAVGRHDTSDLWNDMMVRHTQLHRDDGSVGIYELSCYGPSDDDDVNDATLEGADYIAREQQRAAAAATCEHWGINVKKTSVL